MKNIDNILLKARQCLNCKKPMCKKGCPISTDIPTFISKIKENKFEEAYYILQENNLLSEICSNICPVENQCMGSCIKGIKGEPIQINYLEKFVNNWANDNNIEYIPNIKPNNNTSVAVIGSGPAGIAAAVELRKAGFNVTIFEKEEKYGGILEYGIPEFRLDKNIVQSIVKRVAKMGIDFKNNIEFGKDITLQDLKKQGYQFIFLGIGAQKQKKYNLTNKKTNYIFESDEFLKIYNKRNTIKNLGITVVIGGGNVALDSARTAIKMGAERVYVLYRRNKEFMPAREVEYEEALKDGVNVKFHTKVISVKIHENRPIEIECIKTNILNKRIVDISNSNYSMLANTVIFAIGAKADENLLNEMGILTENGLVCVDNNFMTNIDCVYAGGDLVENKSSVCKAIATGKKAAKAIIDRKESDK